MRVNNLYITYNTLYMYTFEHKIEKKRRHVILREKQLNKRNRILNKNPHENAKNAIIEICLALRSG